MRLLSTAKFKDVYSSGGLRALFIYNNILYRHCWDQKSQNYGFLLRSVGKRATWDVLEGGHPGMY